MSVTFDQKEDLRLRMADLEKKLAESEEERCKLEKTCNVLMRAFREEEKMQYRELNKKYEKFLEDCSTRKRRNDIILRSLCRIEDRSRALFAKTERLKLLKDRYISYLNISDYKKGEISAQPLRTLSPPSQKFTSDVTSRHLHWKTPLATYLKTERAKEAVRDLFEESNSANTIAGNFENFEPEKPKYNQGYEEKKKIDANAFNIITTVEKPSTSSFQNLLKTDKNVYNSHDFQSNASTKENPLRAGNFIASNGTGEISSLKREKKVIGFSDSIGNSERGLPSEGEHFSIRNVGEKQDSYAGKFVEKDDVEQEYSIKQQNKSNDGLFPRINYNWSSNATAVNVENQELINVESENKSDSQSGNLEDHILNHSSEKNLKSLPLGLDGVDYQNETYPESYYEQPVHRHNHTSIASDVILEEDETEQEFDEEENNYTPNHSFGENHVKESSRGSLEYGTIDESHRITDTNKQTEETNKGDIINSQAFDEVKSRESDSEKSLEAKQTDKSERSESVVTEKSDKNKTMVKSNLIHLLESDSESFQIEHGDVPSGNEDSDFDFSFHQN